MAHVPYQGYQLVQQPIKPTLQQTIRGVRLSQHAVNIGDPVEWIVLKPKPGEALYTKESAIIVVASGKIKEILGDNILVEVEKIESENVFRDKALLRFPNLARQVFDQLALRRHKTLSPDIYLAEMKSNKKDEDTSALVTALTFIANFATFLILAF